MKLFQDPKVLSLGYVAIGKLVNKFPQLVASNIALVQVFFHIMCQVRTLNIEVRKAVEHTALGS